MEHSDGESGGSKCRREKQIIPLKELAHSFLERRAFHRISVVESFEGVNLLDQRHESWVHLALPLREQSTNARNLCMSM